ncbi:integrase core domain-containing protein [Corynebacterium pseudotuberculosis]|nr:integrase core domain-containing protein [Corynebacterium pseudotuberculosis]QGX02929.1 transposase [Corynebacterium pseudotuberculosis Cp162]WFP66752.1 integrase core domain-containing protein [Corynebacterium pseudotuberculosis]
MGIKQNGTPYHRQTQGKVERFHQTLQQALARRKTARNLGELNQQLREIIDYYNTQRPHRALDRTTPHTAYHALPKAQPAGLPLGNDNRLRHNIIDSAGKVSLRWAGEFRKLYIGTRYAGMPIILVCLNNNITAVNPETTEILGRYLLEKGRSYHRNLLKDPHQPNPDKKKSLETSNRNDVSRLHTLATNEGAPCHRPHSTASSRTSQQRLNKATTHSPMPFLQQQTRRRRQKLESVNQGVHRI